jgi:hypothetical protein
MEKDELLWKQYQQNVELYKFYMDLVIKFNIFYYAVTGAILSFFFKNTALPNIKYSLAFPIIISVAFTCFFLYGAHLMTYLRKEVFSIRDALGLQVAPDVGVLTVLLRIFAAVFFIVALGCSYMIVKF